MSRLALIAVVLGTLALTGCDIPAPDPGPPNPDPPVATVAELADGITVFEGWSVGSLTWRHRNPGAIRWVGWQQNYGGQPCDAELVRRINCVPGFTVFNSTAQGREALVALIQHYRANFPYWSLRDFTGRYAPASDQNDPGAYAAFLADYMDVPVETTLAEIERVK